MADKTPRAKSTSTATKSVKKAAARAPKVKGEVTAWTPPPGVKQADPAAPPKTLTFQGREIAVRAPTGEQMLVWSDILGEIQEADAAKLTMDQVVAIGGDLYLILDAIMVEDADRKWIRRGRIQGTVDLEGSSKLFMDTIKLYEEELAAAAPPANRAARRAR